MMRTAAAFFSLSLCVLIGREAHSQAFPLPGKGDSKFCRSFHETSPFRNALFPVPASWEMSDCQTFAKNIEGEQWAVGCFFAKSPSHRPSWSFGAQTLVSVPPSAASRPKDNCGW